MTKKITVIVASAVLAAQGIAPTPAVAANAAAATQAASELEYGSHRLQRMDFYPAVSRDGEALPTIVFVHGGAWAGGDKSDSTGQAKIRHYTEAGYNLVSVNYRLLPEVTIEQQAQDVASALDDILVNARKLGVDPTRIVLMGHSAGAHLSALLATDPSYLDAHDRSPRDIAGVVLLDGPAYDVPRQIVDAGPLLGFGYQLAFGNRIGRQDTLSPVHHADGKDARRFLMIHVERPDAKRQAEKLADVLEREGTDAEVMAFPGRGMEGHNLLNAMLGRRDSPATVPVDEWLAATFAIRR